MTGLRSARTAILGLAEEHELVTVWAIAVVVRASYVMVVRPDPLNVVDSAEYDGLARDLLAGHGLTEPTGFVRPPLYPLFVAACYAVGGIVVLQVAQIALGAATASLVALLSKRLYASRQSVWAAGIISAFYPWFLPFVGGLASETLFSFLAVAAFLLVRASADGPTSGRILGGGIALGIASLARSNILVCAPFLALWWVTRPQRWRAVVTFTAGLFIALAPFGLFELATGHGLVVASSGGGLNFYVGNSPDAARYYSDDLPAPEWRELGAHLLGPSGLAFAGCQAGVLQVECVAPLPPAEREVFWYRAGVRYIVSAPREWLGLELHKLIAYWRPWVDPRGASAAAVVVSGASFSFVLVFALAGMRLMPRTSALFVIAVAAALTFAAVGWLAFPRYRFALLDPLLIAAAGPAVTAFATTTRQRLAPRA